MQTGTCTYTVRTMVHFYGMGENNPKNTVEVTSRDPDQVLIPDKAHSFVFYDKVTAMVELNDQLVTLVNQDEHVFPFEKLNQSSVYYCGGKLYSLEDGELLFRDHESVDTSFEDDLERSTLFDEIREGKWPGATHVIQRRDGSIDPFRQGTNVIVPVPEPVTA